MLNGECLALLCTGAMPRDYNLCCSSSSAEEKKGYREIIEPELKQYGYEFVSSTTPRLFDVGPFPKVALEIGGVQTKTPLGRGGEYTEYRIVQFINPADGIKKNELDQVRF